MLIPINKKWSAVVLFGLVLMASSCKKDKDKETEPPLNPNQDLNTVIQGLEKSGDLPTLDRSNELAGPDKDGNGVRDDIDVYIAKLNATAQQKKAFTQVAKATQATLLIDTNDPIALNAAGKATFDAIMCVSSRFNNDENKDNKSYKINRKIENLVVNTKARAAQYQKYNRASSGSVDQLPTGNTCHD